MATLQAVTEQTRDAGAEASRTLASRIEGAAAGFEVAATRMTEMLARAASGTSEALAQGASKAAEGLEMAAADVRDMLRTVGQVLSQQSCTLAETVEALAGRIAELDRAAKEAVAPFAAGAHDLRRTAEAAQEATTQLMPVADNLGKAAEQIGRAAQRFEAAQAGALKLSEDVSTAAKRFEGVDRSLAGTLTALGSALDEFRRRIQEFVGDTNRDLATAAKYVSAMVSELGETLEDFGLERRPN